MVNPLRPLRLKKFNNAPRKIQEISGELNEEGPRIIDYGVYNADTVDLTSLLDNFTDTAYAPYFLNAT